MSINFLRNFKNAYLHKETQWLLWKTVSETIENHILSNILYCRRKPFFDGKPSLHPENIIVEHCCQTHFYEEV